MASLGSFKKGIVYTKGGLGQTGISTSTGAASSYDPDAVAYFTEVESAGGTLSDNVKAEYNAFVLREKENSRYSKLKRLYPYLGGVIDSARIDAITLASATNNNFVDADADALVGLQGDGSTKLLRAGYNFVDALNDPISKIQYGTFTNGYNLVGVNNGFAMGTVDTVSGYYYYSLISTSGVFNGYTGLGAASAGQTGITNEVGLFKHSAARYSTTSAYVLVNGVESTEDTDSNALAPSPTREICLFGRNTNGAFGLFFPEEVYMQYISEFDTLQESKDFESSYNTFLTNIQAYAAAQAYFAAVEGAGGTLSTNVKSEFTSFVTREIENNRWDKIKRLYPYLGGVIDSARVDAITLNSATNNNFVDGDVDPLVGLQGDGSTKLLLSDLPSAIWTSANNIQTYAFVSDVGALSSDNGYFGAQDGTSRILQRTRTFGNFNVYLYAGNLTTFANSTVAYTASGYSVISGRYSNSDVTISNNGTTSTNSSTISPVFPTVNMAIFGNNNSGAYSFSTSKLDVLAFLDAATKAEMTAFESSYQTFINNIKAYQAAQDYFEAVEAAGGTLTTATKTSFTNFVQREVDNGRWDKLKRLYPYLGGTIDGARIDAITLGSATNNNFVDANADSLIGLQGDGSTKYLTDIESPSQIFDGQFDWGGYILGISTMANGIGDTFAWGSYTPTTSTQWLYTQRAGVLKPQGRGNLLSITVTGSDLAPAGGSISVNRTSNTSIKLFLDGALDVADTTLDTGTLSTVLMNYMAGSNNGNPLGYQSGNVGCIALWSGFTDADVAGYDTSYKTFLTDIEIERNGWWNGSQTGLLDSYPSASAAYSVRALNSAYTGALLRVRRSSDNAEQDIHAMADGNLDTTSLLSFVGANDGFVVTWYDQSGNGLDVTNTTASNQPQIVSSGVLETQGTKASLVADGTKYLTIPSGFNHSGTLTGIGVKYTDGSPSHAIYQIGAVNQAGNLFSTPTVSTSRNSVGKESVIGVSSINQHQIQSGFFTNGRQDVWVNGVKGGTQSSVAMATATNLPLFIGALSSTVYRFVGSLQEVLLYSSDKTSDLTDIESNIITYYGIS